MYNAQLEAFLHAGNLELLAKLYFRELAGFAQLTTFS